MLYNMYYFPTWMSRAYEHGVRKIFAYLAYYEK